MVSGVIDTVPKGHHKGYNKQNRHSEPMRPWPPMYRNGINNIVVPIQQQQQQKLIQNGVNYSLAAHRHSSESGKNINEGFYRRNNHKYNMGSGDPNKSTLHFINGQGKPFNFSPFPYGSSSISGMSTRFNNKGLLMIDKDDKSESSRKTKMPTKYSSHNSCPCVPNSRSRSMEDVRNDVVVDWPPHNTNNNSKNNVGLNRIHPMVIGGNNSGKIGTRRSMDNLLEIDTSFGKKFQSIPSNDPNRPKFVAVTSLEDVQAVRCAEFHPNGRVYAVGSNSKTFRLCEYPSLVEIREEHTTYQPTVLFKRTKHHKGSIYCMAWSPQGDLVATGSNDKTVKLMRYNDVQKQLEGRETELTMHDGTVRDLCFLEDSTNKSSLLISGGAGDCKIYVTDCATSTPFQALSGHGGHVLSLYNWGGAMFVSGSHDKTVRFWDLRTRGCVNMVTPATVPGSRQGSPVAAICVDPSGRLLVSGHEDSSCVLYDIRGNRPIQCFKPHSSDIRSIRFSPSAYYLLTGGYDNKLVLTDLQGDLTMPLPSVVVAQHTDKVISGRWHPTDFSFLSTSADKTATLWALPPM